MRERGGDGGVEGRGEEEGGGRGKRFAIENITLKGYLYIHVKNTINLQNAPL